MRVVVIVGPIRVLDLILFETMDRVEPDEVDRPRHDEDDGPDDLDKRLRGED